jgi:hypothetical protein
MDVTDRINIRNNVSQRNKTHPGNFKPLHSTIILLDVHGSVHLGNICSIEGPTRCTYYVFFIPLYFLALHVSGAIAPILRSSNCSLQP